MTISSSASHPATDDFIAATDVEVLSTEQVAEVRRVALARFDPARRLTRVTDPLPATLSQSEGLLHDLAAAGRLAERSIAVSTAHTYDSNLSYWEDYCATNGVAPYPPHPSVVSAWVASMTFRKEDAEGHREIGTGLVPATISQRIAALSKVCAAHGWPKPADDPHVAEVLAGCRRTVGVRPRRQVAPLDVEVMRAVLSTIDETSPRQLRDLVVLLLGQDARVLPGSLARVPWSDVTLTELGASLLLPPTRRNGPRVLVEFQATRTDTCVVAALHRWRTACETSSGWLVPHIAGNGIVDRPVGGREGVHRILRRTRAVVGADGVLDDAQLTAACAAVLAPSPLDLRDRSMLLTAFFTAARRSNVCRLTFHDMKYDPRRGVQVFFDRTKTDQIGAGTEKWLPHGETPQTCPVRAFLAWHRTVTDLLGYDPSKSPTPIPVFSGLAKGGALDLDANGVPIALSGDWFANIVQSRVAAAGFDPTLYAGHSARAGFITAAVEAGLGIAEIQQVSNHRNVSVLMGYVRRVEAWKNNPAAAIGL